jgi:pectate lyase
MPAAPTDAGPDVADSRSKRPIDAAEDADPGDGRAGEPPPPTAIPDGGYLVVEDFEDGDADGWQVLPWTDASVPGPGWLASASDAGSIYAEESLDATSWHITYSMTASSSDQIVEARMRVVDFYARAPSYAAALFGRYHPGTDSGYLVALRGDGSLVIRRRDHGITSSWNGGVELGIEPGVWYTVRLEILGDTINAYLDGTFVCSATDASPLPAGGVALGTFGARVEVDRVLLAAP